MTRPAAPTTPRAARKRPLMTLSLSPEAIARLHELAERAGDSCSGTVEGLIRQATMPRRIG